METSSADFAPLGTLSPVTSSTDSRIELLELSSKLTCQIIEVFRPYGLSGLERDVQPSYGTLHHATPLSITSGPGGTNRTGHRSGEGRARIAGARRSAMSKTLTVVLALAVGLAVGIAAGQAA